MKVFQFIATGSLVFLTSCAAMFNKTEEPVQFVNVPQSGTTVVSTPHGKVHVKDGHSGSQIMSRSRKNVPITVTCPDHSVHHGEIVTEFDYGVGGALNILNFPIGFLVDPFTDRAFLFNRVDVSRYCQGTTSRTKPGSLSPLGIE